MFSILPQSITEICRIWSLNPFIPVAPRIREIKKLECNQILVKEPYRVQNEKSRVACMQGQHMLKELCPGIPKGCLGPSALSISLKGNNSQ